MHAIEHHCRLGEDPDTMLSFQRMLTIRHLREVLAAELEVAVDAGGLVHHQRRLE